MSQSFQVHVAEDFIKELCLEEVNKKLEKVLMDHLLMDSKELCRTLSLSWPTVEKIFLHDPEFPKMRVGKKWVFNKLEVQEYINKWSIEIREKKGGIVLE